MKSHSIKLRVAIFAILILALFTDSALAYTYDSNVNTPSAEDIVAYSNEHPVQLPGLDRYGNSTSSYSIIYNEKPSLTYPYDAGSLSSDELLCALNTIKTIRYIAGISDKIYLYFDYNKLAQAACLVTYANNKLSHTPESPSGMGSALSALGIKGAGECNLAKTSGLNENLHSAIINGWMYDSDSANISSLGHRRWILNPSLSATGFGNISGSKGTFSAMYVYDYANKDYNYYNVAWPASNTPTSYFAPGSAWSVSVGEKIDISSVQVLLKRKSDGKVWSFSKDLSDGDFYLNNNYYGQLGCIIFRPSGLNSYEAGDEYNVEIKGDTLYYNYDVSFFDLEDYYTPSVPSLKSVELNSNNNAVITWELSKDAYYYKLYRKCYNGSWKLITDNIATNKYTDTSTGNGIKYCYAISAVKKVDGIEYISDRCLWKSVNTTLPAVSNLKVRASSNNINISWSAVDKASGYKVYRRVAGTSTWKLVKTTSSTSYKDTSVKKGTRYQYKVRAYRTMYSYKVYSNYCAYRAATAR